MIGFREWKMIADWISLKSIEFKWFRRLHRLPVVNWISINYEINVKGKWKRLGNDRRRFGNGKTIESFRFFLHFFLLVIHFGCLLPAKVEQPPTIGHLRKKKAKKSHRLKAVFEFGAREISGQSAPVPFWNLKSAIKKYLNRLLFTRACGPEFFQQNSFIRF